MTDDGDERALYRTTNGHFFRYILKDMRDTLPHHQAGGTSAYEEDLVLLSRLEAGKRLVRSYSTVPRRSFPIDIAIWENEGGAISRPVTAKPIGPGHA